jgi:hypothetical protein
MSTMISTLNNILDDLIILYDTKPRQAFAQLKDFKVLLNDLVNQTNDATFRNYQFQVDGLIQKMSSVFAEYRLQSSSVDFFKGDSVKIIVHVSGKSIPIFTLQVGNQSATSIDQQSLLMISLEEPITLGVYPVKIFEEEQLVTTLEFLVKSPLNIKDLGL